MCQSFDDFLFDCPSYPSKGEKTCLMCGGLFTGSKAFCCNECRYESIVIINRRKIGYVKKKCLTCGNQFYGNNARRFCSNACSRKHHHAIGSARRRNAPVREKVSIELLMEKQNGRCDHCGTLMTLHDTSRSKRAATIDHIIPITKGGWHVQANCRLLCRSCNSKRGNRGLDDNDRNSMKMIETFNVSSH